MAEVVAERKFVLMSLSSEEKVNMSIQVLTPISDPDGIDYACELRVINFAVWNRSKFKFHGVDSMQALQLALEFKDKILIAIEELYSVDLLEE